MTTNGISILLLARSLEIGGAERQLVELAKGLHRCGCNVTVAVFYKKGALLAELEGAGVRVIDLRKKGRWDLLVFLARTRHAISEARPDVLYSFLGGPNLVAAAVRPLVPRMKMVWSIRASDVDLAHYGWLHGAAYRLESGLSNSPDLIISNSDSGRQFAAAHGFPRDRIAVVPNGIDTDRFRPDPLLRAEQRGKWNLADHQTAVGVLARLDPMKGHETFLRAAAQISPERPEMRFFCIGAGPLQAKLTRLAADLRLAGRVTFTGASDPVPALNALDICCSSSVFGEGFSNAVAEAMACGVPCVVTDVGDSRLIVGDTGLVVPRSDPEALGQAIAGLAAGLNDEHKAEARRRIVEEYSVQRMIERTLAELARLKLRPVSAP